MGLPWRIEDNSNSKTLLPFCLCEWAFSFLSSKNLAPFPSLSPSPLADSPTAELVPEDAEKYAALLCTEEDQTQPLYFICVNLIFNQYKYMSTADVTVLWPTLRNI